MAPPVPPFLQGQVCWVLGPDGRTPREVTVEQGTAWMNAHGSVPLAFDEGTGWEVSSVFLPRFADPGVRPDLFETRIRVRGQADRFEPSATYEEAEETHAGAVAALARSGPAEGSLLQ